MRLLIVCLLRSNFNTREIDSREHVQPFLHESLQ